MRARPTIRAGEGCKRRRSPAALLLAGASLAALAASAAQAQQAVLEEVIVTAQRREQPLQDVPLSITAIGTQALEQRNYRTINDLSGMVPNLTIALNGGGTTPAIVIRGSATTDVDPALELPVGMYVDGVYLSKTAGSMLSLPGIEHVEVLRGPQGTLFGRNTLAGAINIVTKKPSGEFGGMLRVGAGNYSRRDISGLVDLPSFGKVSLQLSGRHERHDGYVKIGPNPYANVANAQAPSISEADKLNSTALRAALRIQPVETFTIDYSFLYSKYDNTPPYSQLTGVAPGLIFDPASPNYVGALVNGTYLGFPANLYVRPKRIGTGFINGSLNTSGPLIEELRSPMHGLTLEWEAMDSLTLKSITGIRDMKVAHHTDVDGTPLPLSGTQRFIDYDSFSEEVQAIAKIGRFDATAGFYYFKDDGRKRDFQQFFGTTNFLDRQVGFSSKAYAFYGQVEWNPPILDDRLHLIAGLRYSDESKTTDPFIRRFFTNGAAPQTIVPDTAFAKRSWDGTTPAFTAKYDVSDNFNVYARYAEGFKSGGFNPSVNDPVQSLLAFDPETVRSYEAGAKGTFLDGRLQMGVSIFRNVSKDAQVGTLLGDGTVNTVIANAGGVRVQGFEIDATARPVDWLTLTGSLGHLKGKFTRYISAGVDIRNDRTFQYAPSLTANISADATLYQGPIGELHLILDYAHSSAYWGLVSPPAFSFRADASDFVNGRLALQNIPVGERSAEVAVWVKNLMNDFYGVAGANFGSGFGGLTYTTFNPPRTFGIDLTFRF